MSNPIFSPFPRRQPKPQTTPQKATNPMASAINQVKQSPNPQKTMQDMLANNPNFQNIVNYINQNGGDARSAFYNMAAQKGIDPNLILSQLK